MFGEVRPEDHVVAFRGVFAHITMCVQNKKMSELSANVDERKLQIYMYGDMCKEDDTKYLGVSPRVELTSLVDMLKEMIHP